MEPQEQPFRRPRNWKILCALESLNPPSPSCSLDALSSIGSSGEIPIFLHDSIEHTSSDQENRSSVMSMSTAPRSRPQSGQFLKPSSSMATFRSTNTFGMPQVSRRNIKRLTVDVPMPDHASDRAARRSSLRVPTPGQSLLTVRPSRSGEYWNNRFSTISDLVSLTITTPTDSVHDELPSPNEAGYPRPSPSVPFAVCSSDSIVISPADDYTETRHRYPSQTVFDSFMFPPSQSADNSDSSDGLVPPPSRSWSALSSVLFARRSVSPTPSITSTALSDDFSVAPTIRFRSPLLRDTLNSRTSSRQSDLPSSPVPRSPSPHLQSNNRLTVPPSSPVREIRTSRPISQPLLNFVTDSGSGSGHPRPNKRTRELADLPQVLSWMREICIELWIDQEGFRAIKPKFQLVGYTSSPSTSSSPADELAAALTYGVALFRPVKRETSVYHHGTLDSTPTLRRLTLADNEDKDYISRQASLTIKANGVYSVTGMESFEDQPFGPATGGLAQVAGSLLGVEQPPSLQLQWRFEYAVDDTKTDAGRFLPGEKTLTPLSFSCSPGLLHPSHGKRIHLMHVLKKNIVPKLSAAKMASPPEPIAVEPEPDAHTMDHNFYSRPPQRTERANIRRSLPENTRRRTRSTELSERTRPLFIHGPESVNGKNRPASISGGIRRRAGSLDLSEATAYPVTANVTYHVNANNCTPVASPKLSLQILSREELAAILASFPNPTQTQRVPKMTSVVRPLSPPSYYRHRRLGSSMDHVVDELGVVLF